MRSKTTTILIGSNPKVKGVLGVRGVSGVKEKGSKETGLGKPAVGKRPGKGKIKKN